MVSCHDYDFVYGNRQVTHTINVAALWVSYRVVVTCTQGSGDLYRCQYLLKSPNDAMRFYPRVKPPITLCLSH